MKKWSSLLLLILFIAACKSKPTGSLEVKGTVKNLDLLAEQYPGTVKEGAITLMLFEVPFGSDAQPIQLDSVTITGQNNFFTLKGNTSAIGMYDIMVDRGGPMIPLVNDEPEIRVNLDFKSKEKFYTVSGSEASKQLQDFIYAYSDYSNVINKELATIDSLKKLEAPDSILIVATNKKNKAIDGLNNFLKQYLLTIKQGTVASFALGRSAQTLITADFETEMNKLLQKFPQDASLAAIKNQYNAFKAQSEEMERRRQQGSWIGKKAPELILPDPNGKQIALSSFKGKYVLVDFWASWCGPCRRENPNVVAAYNQFKNKNFTILGVSLDEKKEAWIEAIQSDGLNWTHVSDLAFWKSKAVTTFGFEGIPFNILIDPQGNVVAEALRGSELINKLSEVVK